MPAEATPAPNPRPGNRRDGRWLVVGLLLLQLALFFAISPRLNVVQVAHTWGVLTLRPDFSDLYLIPAAGAGRLAGEDPYVANPRDPWHRVFNYPPVWMYVWTSIPPPDAYRLVALGMGIFATAGWLGYLGRLSLTQGAFVGLLACSPPVLLAAQRANTDLLIFGLLAVGLTLLRKGPGWAGYAALVAAGWLKLYPLAALVVVLREPRERLRRIGPVVLGAGALCFVAYASYLGRLYANTPAGGLHSYGSRVPAFWFDFFLPAYGWSIDRVLLGHIFSVLALFLGLLALRTSLGRLPLLQADTDRSALDGLRAGGAIYVFTFLLGVSFDYRLIFLLLVLPALFALAAGPAPGRVWGRIGLGLVFAAMGPNGLFWKPLLVVKEAGSWALFFTLAVLLVRTLPADWSKSFSRAGSGGPAGPAGDFVA
jgi:hypothetical protein